MRRRFTSPASTDASAYSRRAAVADSVWNLQDRARAGLGSAFWRIADAPGRAFERIAFPLQERLVWPVEDRAAAMGAPARSLSFGLVVLLAAAAGVAGLVWAAPDRPHGTVATEVAASAPLAAAGPTAGKATKPTLHGAAPDFKPAPGQSASEVDPAKAVIQSSSSDSPSAPAAAGASTAAASTASTSSARGSAVDGPPAGPAAISVARDFAGAFVLYETGGIDAGVREAFGETATPELARALLKRPPRLPANVEVPKAKVLNVVPSPSHGDVYPISVSLLRVGLTSELRLDMEQRKGDRWRVTNVLG